MPEPQIVSVPGEQLVSVQPDDPGVPERFQKLISSGHTFSSAAVILGMSTHTFYKWWTEGEHALHMLEEGQPFKTALQERKARWFKHVSPSWGRRMHKLVKDIEAGTDSKQSKVLMDLVTKLYPKEFNDKFQLILKEELQERKELQMEWGDKLALLENILKPNGLLQAMVRDDRTGKVRELLRGFVDTCGISGAPRPGNKQVSNKELST